MTATQAPAPLGLGVRGVTVVDHVWIEMPDGCHLSARLWLPEGSEKDPVGTVLECVPYRKNDGTAAGDDQQMRFFASHGFAGVRLDLRGSGDSEGILTDEYTPGEQADIVATLAWIGAQPWCSGRVGMMGASWGGFNSLQVAALRPPELAAIISVYAADDRYGDDVHYRGGCVLGMDMLHWAASMLAFNAKPPDPAVVGEGWRDAWLDRLERTPYLIENWLTHQRRDAYWRQGSVCEDYSAIECPVLAIGGWTDGYTDAVLRLLEHLDSPSRGLIGPWGHNDPASGAPSPHAGFLSECLRWWRHWLGGEETGLMDEPQLRFFMQERAEPAGDLAERPGRWESETAWPPPGRSALRLSTGARGSLATEAGEPVELSQRGLQSCGLDGGAWCADGRSADLPLDQRRDEGASIVFTSEPLVEPLEIVGFCRLRAELASDRRWALLSARLADVEPAGGSALVTRGQLNLTHREGHHRVVDIDPGERFSAELEMDAIAHRFEAGHRIRLALSPTYWPLAWPSPEPVELTVLAGDGTWIELPVRPASPPDPSMRLPDPPETGLPERPSTVLREHHGGRRVVRDLSRGGRVDLVFDWDQGGLYRDEVSGIESEDFSTVRYSIADDDPLSAEVECRNKFVTARGEGWRTHGEFVARMTSTATEFVIDTEAEVFEADEPVWTRRWEHRIPRDGV